MRSLVLSLFCLGLAGCFTRVEIRHTRMPLLELPEKPQLVGDPQQDLPVLGGHAMKLRQLIHDYNAEAAAHNARHGL